MLMTNHVFMQGITVNLTLRDNKATGKDYKNTVRYPKELYGTLRSSEQPLLMIHS